MTQRPKILIADDHPILRAGLRRAIFDDPRFELVDETGDGQAALKFILEKKPEVAVLALNLPGMTGLEIARKLHGALSPTRVIVLTKDSEEELCKRVLENGAMGFIFKENAIEEIVKAITVVAEGRHYFSPGIPADFFLSRNRAESLAKENPGLDDLTKAEQRIFKLISMKKTSREIAAELYISPRTVEAHRANICFKLHLHGSHSLLQFALVNHSSFIQSSNRTA